MCGLSLLVCDTRAKTAAAVGFSAGRAEIVQPENGILVRTNHYTTPLMQEVEVAPHAWRDNSRARLGRITELLEAKRGALVPEDVPAILSDCFDPYEKRKRVTGDIVAAPHNVESVVFCPDDDAVWIAHSDFPVCHSDRFHGFRISALFEGNPERYACRDLPGGAQLNETERGALAEYEAAWSAYMDEQDTDRAVSHLRRAGAALPEEPIFPRMAGLLLLKQKKYAQALPMLLKNAEYDYKNTLMHAEAHIWVARCLDLMGRRAEALARYEMAEKLFAPPVSTAAAQHRSRPFTRKDLFYVSPEFLVGTGIAKY